MWVCLHVFGCECVAVRVMLNALCRCHVVWGLPSFCTQLALDSVAILVSLGRRHCHVQQHNTFVARVGNYLSPCSLCKAEVIADIRSVFDMCTCVCVCVHMYIYAHTCTYVHGVSCFHLAMYCCRRRDWGSCYRNPATIRYKQVQMKVSTHCVHVTTLDLRMGRGCWMDSSLNLFLSVFNVCVCVCGVMWCTLGPR